MAKRLIWKWGPHLKIYSHHLKDRKGLKHKGTPDVLIGRPQSVYISNNISSLTIKADAPQGCSNSFMPMIVCPSIAPNPSITSRMTPLLLA